MSVTYIQTTDKEFHDIVAKATADGYAKAIKDTKQKSQLDDDTITEAEALVLLKCGKSKLAKMRASKDIVFYTFTRPFHYSKKSIERYIES